jgi:N-acetylglucosaminyldiphosphoundecaprenol N-acetyl-beta-D-mannosaminyltransferase
MSRAPDLKLERKREEARLSARRAACPARRVLGMRVDATSYAETAALVVDLGAARAGGMVCVANVHVVMEAHDCPEFRRTVNAADRVTPDGMPLVWALRARGLPQATRVYGPNLVLEICARAAARGVSLGLYGGTPEVLARLGDALRARAPGLSIAFVHSPPFRPLGPDEDRAVCDAIAASGVGVLLVGLGCPRQERWMAAHRDRLGCALVGVGAAFDFLSGAKPQAPRWMQGAGLEWLFRLACEPRRLWRRYLVGNARFLYHALRRGGRA